MVDGETAEHQVLTGCDLFGGGSAGSPNSNRLHIWRLPTRGVLVYMVLLGPEGAEQQVSAVEDLLQNASWK